ncbi:cytochrome P450 [Hysterangium stoloniferum]|nr:cytochrome P450 [Hysterangium stoloniferum]
MLLITSFFVALLLYAIHHGYKRPRTGPLEPDISTKRALWYIGTPESFLDPFRFISESMEWAKGSMFSFKVLSNTVVVLRGIPGRDAFLSKGLDFMTGYRLLNPQLVDITPVNEISGDETWTRFMAKFIQAGVLGKMYPTMVHDVSEILDTWGNCGEIDPFENIPEKSFQKMIFVLSVRVTTCREFSDNPKSIKRLMKIFDRMEAGSKPTSILFPWVPTPARIGRLLAGGELYKMINDVVQTRKTEGRHEDDPLQALIDKEFSLIDITRFIALMLFAAVNNTGNVLCWVMLYLETNPAWKARVQGEIDNFIQDNCPDSPDIPSFLATVSIDYLDKATSDLELSIHETLRMIFTGTFMRQNIGDDIFVSGRRIKHGTFLMFPTGDLHFNPTFYPNPDVFDPTIFTAQAIEARHRHGVTFLGWGASRHVCVGRRTALLMMKTTMVLIMSRFRTDLVDAKGTPVQQVPPALHNALFKVCSPAPEHRVQLRYRMVSVE